MSEWWTYSLSDFVMFSSDTYYRLFELENRRLWPFQAFAVMGGFATIVLIRRGTTTSLRVGIVLLGCAWAVCSGVYFRLYYSSIHTFGLWFALTFGIEAAALLLHSVVRSRCRAHTLASRIGLSILVFAVCLQPLIGVFLGRSLGSTELLALTPDATVTATAGVLLAIGHARWLWVIPIIWSLYSGATLLTLGSVDALVGPTLVVIAFSIALFLGLFFDESDRPGGLKKRVIASDSLYEGR
jgi:hypothetical protein